MSVESNGYTQARYTSGVDGEVRGLVEDLITFRRTKNCLRYLKYDLGTYDTDTYYLKHLSGIKTASSRCLHRRDTQGRGRRRFRQAEAIIRSVAAQDNSSADC